MFLASKITFIFLLILPILSFAYPELSRHGYTNCTTCHVSPSGGGLLTPYGRELSKEILSTWAKDGEQYFAYNLVKPEDKVLLGAFVRGLQAQREDETKREGRSILMQSDLEAGYNSEKWAAVASVGRQEIRSGFQSEGRLFSRRHYVMYRPTDEISIRVGKFLKFYGLNHANHNLYVRKDLGFGFDTETYNIESAYLGENWSGYLTYADGSIENSQYVQLKEKAITASVSYFLFEKHKFGLSYYRGEDDLTRRWVGGPWMIISISPKIFFMSEYDWQNKDIKLNQSNQHGYVTSNRLSFEGFQGFISFLSFDKKFLNSSDPNTEQKALGVGIQFFPRPHFEFVASWQKEEVIATQTKSDLIWLMTYFYL